MTTKMDKAFELASRPEGVAQHDLLKLLPWTRQQASNTLWFLEKHPKYKVFVVRNQAREKRVFAKEADADAWRARHPSNHTIGTWPVTSKAKHTRPFSPTACGPARVVPTKGVGYLGYDARFQVAPGERVHGAGFAAVGIGRDVTTGRPWGQ